MVAGRILAATLVASGLSQAANANANAAAAAVASDDDSFGPSIEVARARGPQIFNAVHDAMRQWGASLHHNGMSFFLATVPEGVILHHGNNAEESPDEPDWLAYEIEHAEGFARGGRGPPGGPGGPGKGPGDGGPPPGGPPPLDMNGLSQMPLGGYEGHMREGPMVGRGPYEEEKDDEEQRPTESKGGWLHTYRTTRPLRYLYVDGMSAGKTNMGTLDSQDYLLRRTAAGPATPAAEEKEEGQQQRRPHQRRAGGGGPMGERGRAVDLCELARAWNTSGTIRMEAGFEIIHCDFSDGLEPLQVLQRPSSADGPPHGGGFGSFEFVRGLAERYHDIGSSRTVIDYSSMVSAYFFPVNLTNPDPARPDLPRLVGATGAEIAAIQRYLNQTIAERRDHPVRRPIDWQDVTDLIVGRYADRIKYMAEKTTSARQIADEISFLLTVFLDYSSDEHGGPVPAAVDRCADFYLYGIDPVTEPDALIHAAVRATTSKLCTGLFAVRDIVADAADEEEENDADAGVLARAVAVLRGLMEELAWARFKRCASCDVNEVCFIPMWPLGTKADYEAPRCVNATSLERGRSSESYWGGFGGPGRGRGGRGGRGPRP